MPDENVVFLKDELYNEGDSIWWSSEPILYWDEIKLPDSPASCVVCQKGGIPMTAFQSADEGYHPVWICLPCLQHIVAEVEILEKGRDDD